MSDERKIEKVGKIMGCEVWSDSECPPNEVRFVSTDGLRITNVVRLTNVLPPRNDNERDDD